MVPVVDPIAIWEEPETVPVGRIALISPEVTVPRVVKLEEPAQVERAVFSTLFNDKSVLTSE